MPDAPAPVAVVTGAGSGIGRATAVMLSERGYRLVLAGRRTSKLEETGAACRGEWLAVSTDVAEPADCRHLVEMATGRMGRLDALINNAGLAPLLPIEQTDPETLRRVYAVNALGPACTIVAAWPVFRRQGAGCVVNVSTIGTSDPFPGFFAYAAAKAATEVMVKSCAKEGASVGVRAFGVAPGAVETEMLRAILPPDAVPPDKTLAPEDVARVIAQCIAGEREEPSGTTIPIPNP